MVTECAQWHPWVVNEGLGDTCCLPVDHEGDHIDYRLGHGNTWPRTSTEKKLVEEIKRLKQEVADAEDAAYWAAMGEDL